MHSLKQSLLLPLLSVLSLFLLHNVAAVDPLFSSCPSNSNNYTVSDPFGKNLNQLMSQLATGAPCNGFGLGSVGQGTDKVNGLALCRGDVKSSACRACILAAEARIRQLCPFKKEAVIWYDECLLRYSDLVFFGEVNSQDEYFLVNTQNVSSSPSQFDAEVMKLMDCLKEKAYLSPRSFATNVTEIGPSSEKLYGLAQCSRDLSSEDCNKCLESAIAELPGCCGGRRGGRVVGRSCNVRYELYPFFNA